MPRDWIRNNLTLCATLLLTLLPSQPAASGQENDATHCGVQLIVLGVGQDAGAPQIGNPNDPAWQNRDLQLTATSIAVVETKTGKRYLFDPTPQVTHQLQLLDSLAPPRGPNLGLHGVFITHAHIGHYAGLMFFGREAANTKRLPVYTMSRMKDFLTNNGPWSQLVSLGNIDLIRVQDRATAVVSDALSVTPYQVPHRDEYSETVGFKIQSAEKSALFLPDIDSWNEWEDEFGIRLEDMIDQNDLVFIDATFFDNGELPGVRMSNIPHPRVAATMARLKDLPAEQKSRVHFIHFNHTNPIRFEGSPETAQVNENGFNIARAGQMHCLSKQP